MLAAAALLLPCCGGDIGRGDVVQVATIRVSVGPQGQQANGDSTAYSLSADGRYVAFATGAFNLTPNDANGLYDIFLKDRETGHVENLTNIAVNPAVLFAGNAVQPRLSADGRYIAFLSPGNFESFGAAYTDIGSVYRPILYDRVLRRFTAVRGSNLQYFNNHTYGLSLSADGRYLVFQTTSTNTGFTTTGGQVFLCDFGPNRDQSTLTLVSHTTASLTTAANGSCNVWSGAISADGEIVAFESTATDGAAGDTDPGVDIYFWRRSTGAVTLASLPSAGGNGGLMPGISGDGTTIGYVRHDQSLFPQPHYLNCELYTIATGARRMISEIGVKVLSATPVVLSGDGSRVVYGLDPGSAWQQVLYIEGRGNQLLAVSTTGQLSPVMVYAPGITSDGRWAGFTTSASNMVADDTNGFNDIFLRGPF